ncbi:MAG: hypothetical protein R2851_24565 [Caldilineaceae bacterium]
MPATFGEAGYTTLERMWARPTLEINGMWGGATGAQAARRSSPTRPTPRSRAGWSRTRTPRTSSPRSRAIWRTTSRPACA